jgi:hypothetical protein
MATPVPAARVGAALAGARRGPSSARAVDARGARGKWSSRTRAPAWGRERARVAHRAAQTRARSRPQAARARSGPGGHRAPRRPVFRARCRFGLSVLRWMPIAEYHSHSVMNVKLHALRVLFGSEQHCHKSLYVRHGSRHAARRMHAVAACTPMSAQWRAWVNSACVPWPAIEPIHELENDKCRGSERKLWRRAVTREPGACAPAATRVARSRRARERGVQYQRERERTREPLRQRIQRCCAGRQRAPERARTRGAAHRSHPAHARCATSAAPRSRAA